VHAERQGPRTGEGSASRGPGRLRGSHTRGPGAERPRVSEGANGGGRQRRTASTRIGSSVTVSARSHGGAPRIAIPRRLPTTTYAVRRALTAPSIIRGAMFHVKRCRRRDPPPAPRPLIPPRRSRTAEAPHWPWRDGPSGTPAVASSSAAVPSSSNSFPGPGKNGRVQCLQAPGPGPVERCKARAARPGGNPRPALGTDASMLPSPRPGLTHDKARSHVSRETRASLEGAVRAGALRRPLQRPGMVSRETGRARFH
jgi:hypothetical protein